MKFGHPLRRCAPRPLRFAKGRSWGRFAKRPYVASHSVCEREVALLVEPAAVAREAVPSLVSAESSDFFA